MTNDDFTEAARAEAEGKFPPPRESAVIYPLSAVRSHSRGAFLAGAEWARDHLAAQDPTDAEVLAALNLHECVFWRDEPETDLAAFVGDSVPAMRAALMAARAVGGDAR